MACHRTSLGGISVVVVKRRDTPDPLNTRITCKYPSLVRTSCRLAQVQVVSLAHSECGTVLTTSAPNHAVGVFPTTRGDYEWGQQQQDLVMMGAGSASMPPDLGAVSMNRATDDSVRPQQVYVDPNVPWMNPQCYPNRQGKHARFIGGAPPLALQLGTADTVYPVQYGGQGVADPLGMSPKVQLNGYGASPLEISEGAGSGGAGGFRTIGYVSDFNEGELGFWGTSTAVTGEYGAQREYTDYTHGARSTQSPYDLQPCVGQNGVRSAFKFCHWS